MGDTLRILRQVVRDHGFLAAFSVLNFLSLVAILVSVDLGILENFSKAALATFLVTAITLFILFGFAIADQIKKSRREQAAAQTLLSTIIENIPDMIFLKDAKELRFLLFNKAGEKLLGIPRTELMGKNDYDFFPKEQADHFVAKDRLTLTNQNVLNIVEENIDTRNGRRILHTKKISILDETGNPKFLLGISEDITELKEKENRLAEQQKMLMNSSKFSALGEMAGGIAHEINNPLAVIQGNAEELVELAEAGTIGSAKIIKIGSKIEQTVIRISKIVKGLRSFAREAGNDAFESVSLRTIMDDTLALCQAKLTTHQTILETPSIPLDINIECRPAQISQVLLNLINNAYDAVNDCDTKWIKLGFHDRGDSIELTVADSGPGISDKIHEKIFVPFFTTKEVGKGTGLGLSISKGIVEDHHGVLSVTKLSSPTIFSISLPKRQSAVIVNKAA